MFKRDRGFPPTRPEIARALNVRSISSVNWFLSALERKGLLDVTPDTPRGIRLRDEDLPVVRMGQIGAATSVRDRSRTVAWMPDAVAAEFSPIPTILVLVDDDAIDRIGPRAGDRVAIREPADPADPAIHGRVVLANVRGQLVLRRYRQLEDGQVELSPESTSRRHRVITMSPADAALRFEGVMVGALIGAHID